MRPRLTYANVVATLALFVALGGTAIATHPGGQNTISTGDLQNGQVKTDDIGNGEVKVADIGQGAVATDEIANGQVMTADIGGGQVTEADVGQGAVGSSEVKNDSIANADVAPNSLASGRILDATLTGADVANNSLKGADIDESTLSSIGGGGPAGGDLTGTYPDPQIASNAVGSAEIVDGSLNDEDFGFSLVNFEVSVGVVPARLCTELPVSGMNVAGDHLVLTPDMASQMPQLIYSAEFRTDDVMELQVCNFQDFAINDETTKFNLLAIDAQ